jgi:hypothetical protein
MAALPVVGDQIVITLSGTVMAVGPPYLGSPDTDVIVSLDAPVTGATLRLDARLLEA